ncbi:hypothetical protein LEM8419_01695 [Neolewinella maritima]|uniref:Glycosyl transferase n=1 Tax=Neolewinella maritima TaxID=1383882 RepID=A0ABM9B0D5_9BACT|nr:hypothetical protein [Neolewinella maritima]CAH1000561.1 hypothetical protein LEM8419_01695 [Neolewinella maritima]
MNDVRSIVCTVFERSYHLGVGALANSLYDCNYRGVLYAGYRGALPPWTTGALTEVDGVQVYSVADGLEIHFALQQTDEMLANVKPQLIQQVWARYGEGVENVFYIDCDIIIKAQWPHFEAWAQYGIALVEDMNSPVAVSHPLRLQWTEYYAKFGIDYVPQDSIYVNGGFVGINRRYRGFSSLWHELQVHMKEFTGMQQDQIGIADRWNMFHFMDQDALNVAKDLTAKVTIMGPDAMDFGKFGYVMSHAAGRTKPWEKAFIRDIFVTGARPSFADKQYWQYVDGPIQVFSPAQIRRKRAALKVAVFIGRFFTRT